MKILLIDDDELDRKSISRTLQKSSENCHIIEAGSVDEGLEHLASESFDVALLDYRMPEKDGIELLRTLEKNASLQSTGIIAISSSDDEKVAIKCLKAGAHDFLVKSEICVSKLWRTIAQVKARHELQKQLYESYQKVKQLAEIDPLTGVLNRFAFDKVRKISLINSSQIGSKIALLLIDLDHFKYTNDQYGHEVGDQVLVQTVSRIREVLRKHDTLARLGADEFGLLLTNLSSFNSAGRIAKKIIHAIRQPFKIDRLKLSVTCSIGIALYTDADSHNDDIIKFADIAMYRAKKNGRNQICFFENMMQQHFLKRFQMENHLKQSINDNELTLNYQPVYRCLDKKVLGAEALLRWTHDGIAQSPDKFIPIAEETNFILPIGRWVIEQVIHQISTWQKNGMEDIIIAINLSAVQLSDKGLISYIQQCLMKYEVSPRNIELELTETALLDDDPNKVHFDIIHQLSNMGFKLALDDFGTGFSSVSHLQRFPITVVKIDKSLMIDFDNAKTNILIRALVLMLKKLDLEIVAEGIETQECFNLCEELAIDRAQGFHLALPVNIPTIEKLFIDGVQSSH